MFRLRLDRLINLLKVLGIVPDSLLVWRAKAVSDVIDPILLGIVPVSLFASRSARVSFDNNPILLGIVPFKLLT